MKTVKKASPPRRDPKQVEALEGFAFDMQATALEAAARVVVARALGAQCEGGIKLFGLKYVETLDEITWTDCFDFIGEHHFQKAFIRPAGFAASAALDMWLEDTPLSVDDMWESIQSGERELCSVDYTLADGATVKDLSTCISLVKDSWDAIFQEKECIIAEAVLRSQAWPFIAEKWAA